jgi:hypothetical protein
MTNIKFVFFVPKNEEQSIVYLSKDKYKIWYNLNHSYVL